MSSVESRLNALQCHFTWELEPGPSKLLRVRDKLLDIGTDEGNAWLGPISNLRGFIQYKLHGPTEEAQSLFTQAAEAFRRRAADQGWSHEEEDGDGDGDEGPCLVVTYGNMAWLHHHLGDRGQSEKYLSLVDALMEKHPLPPPPPPSSQDPQHEPEVASKLLPCTVPMHAEVCAEKAWTLMKFGKEQKQQAKYYFEKALEMKPEVVEWYSSYVLTLLNDIKYDYTEQDDEILEKMTIAKERDPENLYLAVHYLDQLAKKTKRIDGEEVRELGRRVLSSPVSSYSGLSDLLWLYERFVSVNEAVALAEEFLEKHPHERYPKRCAALLYKWIVFFRGRELTQIKIERAIRLHEDVIALYPDASLVKKLDLADIYARCTRNPEKSEQMYQEMLKLDLEAADRQMVYHYYAKNLYTFQKDYLMSLEYHMKAAEIAPQTGFRKKSIRDLEKVAENKTHPKCRAIEEFLRNLPEL